MIFHGEEVRQFFINDVWRSKYKCGDKFANYYVPCKDGTHKRRKYEQHSRQDYYKIYFPLSLFVDPLKVLQFLAYLMLAPNLDVRSDRSQKWKNVIVKLPSLLISER